MDSKEKMTVFYASHLDKTGYHKTFELLERK